MKKVLFTATVVKTHINVFHIPYLKMMKDMGCMACVAAKNDFENEPCVIPFCDDFIDIEFSRNPFSVKNVKAYKRLRELIERERFDLIHCHTPVASVVTRLASIGARRKYGTKVIYTAHGFHFYKGAPVVNWLLYYPVEKICSYFTDVLITINKEDYALAKRKMKARRIEYVSGVGLDTKKFANTQVDPAVKRRELGIPEDAVVLMSVGELNHNKNHQVVIKALAQIHNENIHYVIAGMGYLIDELQLLANGLGLAKQVHFLGYRRDISELYKVSDICVFPSIREGLPVALMEAMACGVPVVCSNIRGNTDLIDETGGVLFEPADVDACRNALEKLVGNEKLRRTMAIRNVERVKQFDNAVIYVHMKKIYKSLLDMKTESGK